MENNVRAVKKTQKPQSEIATISTATVKGHGIWSVVKRIHRYTQTMAKYPPPPRVKKKNPDILQKLFSEGDQISP